MHWPSVSNVGKIKVFWRPPKPFLRSDQHKIRWVEHFSCWLNPSGGAPDVSRPTREMPILSQNSDFRAQRPVFGLLMHFWGTCHCGKVHRTLLGWGSLVWGFQKWCQEVKSDLWGPIWGRAGKSSFGRFQRVKKTHEKWGQKSNKLLRF